MPLVLLMHSVPELRVHPVGSLEELTGKGHQFPVGRMIQGLDTCDPGRSAWLLVLQISRQLLLGIVSADGAPVGVVSTDDLIAQLSFKLFSIAGIVAQQSQRER